MKIIGWLLLLMASYAGEAYRILVVFSLPGKSHGILGDGVVRHLLNAGHQVSFITSFPSKDPHPNLTQIDVSSNLEIMPDDLNIKNIMDGKKILDETSKLFKMNYMVSATLANKNVVEVLKDPNQHFDLVIAEWLFNELFSRMNDEGAQPCCLSTIVYKSYTIVAGRLSSAAYAVRTIRWLTDEATASLAAVFQVPLIWLATVEPHSLFLSLVDEYLNPAYNGWAVHDDPPFTFIQRLKELFCIIKITVYRETIIAYLQNHSYEDLVVPYIKQRGMVPPSFKELKYNASLVLGNSHVSMGQATRVPQMYKPVGGYHIEDDSKSLPEDWQKLLDNAKDGVIYFSMGTNLKSKNFSQQLKMDLLKMFGGLNQKVLWKFEEELPNLPHNVQILKWAPQKSILSHPNCVLFITHGGLLSTTETIHTGTPIIGIPVFADQFINVERAVNKGFAKKVPLTYNMAGELKVAIEEILSNPKYTEKVKELSLIYHDRPVKPGVELVHWVEHVIKTGGAPHLRSPALHVPWYQKIFLDVAIVFAIALYAVVKVLKFVKPFVFRIKIINKKKN